VPSRAPLPNSCCMLSPCRRLLHSLTHDTPHVLAVGLSRFSFTFHAHRLRPPVLTWSARWNQHGRPSLVLGTPSMQRECDVTKNICPFDETSNGGMGCSSQKCVTLRTHNLLGCHQKFIAQYAP
jgi:hypothetical protein